MLKTFIHRPHSSPWWTHYSVRVALFLVQLNVKFRSWIYYQHGKTCTELGLTGKVTGGKKTEVKKTVGEKTGWRKHRWEKTGQGELSSCVLKLLVYKLYNIGERVPPLPRAIRNLEVGGNCMTPSDSIILVREPVRKKTAFFVFCLQCSNTSHMRGKCYRRENFALNLCSLNKRKIIVVFQILHLLREKSRFFLHHFHSRIVGKRLSRV